MSARWFGWALAGAALLGGPGCSGNEKEPVCLDSGSYAAVVTVVDANGAAVPDADVTYSKIGGASQTAKCATPACTTWNVEGGGAGSPKQTGTYVIRATSADGLRSAEQTVTVTGNACDQPFTQQLTLTLK